MSDKVYALRMPVPFEPWKDYPSLTLERLTTVGSILRDARDSTVLLHDPDGGDTAWSLGCRVYSRTMFRVRGETLSFDWLRILPESQNLKFTFSIGSLPVKIYKGEPEDIPTRSLVRSFAELAQMRLAFPNVDAKATNMLRIAVGADGAGLATAIVLVEVDEAGTPLRTFEIPRSESENIIGLRPTPITLAPPRIEVIDDDAEQKIRTEALGEDLGTTGTET